MSKGTDISSQTDLFSFIIIVTVFSLSLLHLIPIEILPDIVITALLVLFTVLTSFIYFHRVRQMSESTSTPFSDTLVVLGGISLGISLVLETVSGQLLSLWWPLGLILSGVFGRLLLLDSLISSFFDTVQRLISSVFFWSRDHPLDLIRITLVVVGLYLIYIPIELISIPNESFTGHLIISIVFIIGIFKNEKPNAVTRIFSVIIMIADLFRGSDAWISFETIGIVILVGTILVWNLGYNRLKSFLQVFTKIIRKVVHDLVQGIQRAVHYIRKHKLRSLRVMMVFSGLVFIVYGLFSDLRFSVGGFVLILLAYIQIIYDGVKSIILSIYTFYRDQPLRGLQFTSLLIAPFAYLLVPTTQNYNVIATVILVFVGITPSLYPVVQSIISSLFNLSWEIVTSFVHQLREYPVRTLQIFAAILILPAWFFLPEKIVFNDYALNLLSSLSLLIIAIVPTLVRIIRDLIPTFLSIFQGIIDLIRELVQVGYNLLTSFSTYTWLMTIAGFYGLVTISTQQIYLYILSAILASIGVSLLGNHFLMKIYDRLTLAFTRFSIPLVKFVKFIIPDITWGRVLSLFAWGLLFISIFGFLIPTSIPNRGTVRFILFIASIIIWNSAYPVRRVRFVNTINKITAGLADRLIGLFRWLIRNILSIGLFILGVMFLIIAIGVVIPGSVNIVATLLANIIENRLISWIIGLFLFVMTGYTWQQAFIRRVDLQLEMEGGKHQ